jgi:DNA-binding NtrC family response regulator
VSERPEALVVDDEPNTLHALAELVEREGFATRRAVDLESARREIAACLPDVVLVDLVLPDGDGTELLRDLEEYPSVETILITANATVASAIDALRMGASDYLTKPLDLARLKAVLDRLRRAVALRREVRTLRRQLRELGRFGGLVGTSDAMQEVYDLLERVAPTDTTVLLVGESGTGKELVAQTIHQLSRRADGPFVPVNCGAVSPQLIESELFGHEKGSFTGAERRHRGVFERASRGTLLLDEITEMSEDLQVKLLRVLENRSMHRVGGSREIEVDVRVVAATNRDPEEAVEAGALRRDLYFRLSVFPVMLPPLQARGDDVQLLAVHFLNQLSRAAGRAKEFDRAALEALGRTSSWPGNVRELKNVVERAFILARDRITADCLPPAIRGEASVKSSGFQAPVGTTLDEVVRRHTLATLEHFGGNKKRTAEVLGISLKTLYNRLNRYREGDGSDDAH